MFFLYTPSIKFISQLRSNTGNTLVSNLILAMSVVLVQKSRHSKSKIPKQQRAIDTKAIEKLAKW